MGINSEKFDELKKEIERIRRRRISDFSSSEDFEYIDPYDNIEKIESYNNHLIIGRRGSGKTTLLLTTIKKNNNNIIFPIDSQIYRNWEIEKIIINIFERLCEELLNNLYTDSNYLKIKSNYEYHFRGFLKRIKNIFTKPDMSVKNDYKKYIQLIVGLKASKELLNKLDKLPNEILFKKTEKIKKEEISELISQEEAKIISELKAKGDLSGYNISISSSLNLLSTFTLSKINKSTQSNEILEESEQLQTITRIGELENLKLHIAGIFSDLTKITEKHIILYLDDFYFIPTLIQPVIIQYLHDIYKNSKYSSFCFKVCSLPNRIKINNDGQVDFSFKDDFSPIKLDKELYDLNNLKDFLLRITAFLKPSIGLHVSDISNLFNNDEVLNYTIVATGGVPRDFLITIADLIALAKSESSDTIKKEHLYSIISNLKEDKEQNIEVDIDINPDLLRKAKSIIEKEVIEELNTNVILYPANLAKEHELLLRNLINLRYIHIINENTTSEKIKKENFISYLIDMTFYATGKRLKYGFEFRPFWEKDIESRHIHLRSAPIWSFEKSFIEDDK